MKVRDLLKESEVDNNSLPKNQKNKLRSVLSNMFNTIEKFERGEDITSKDDKEKIEMLRDTIKSMIAEEDRKKVIRGDG